MEARADSGHLPTLGSQTESTLNLLRELSRVYNRDKFAMKY
jgi:hypothetical protein